MGEGITPIYPIISIQPGELESFTIPLPSNTDVYTAHTLTLEIYFIVWMHEGVFTRS